MAGKPTLLEQVTADVPDWGVQQLRDILAANSDKLVSTAQIGVDILRERTDEPREDLLLALFMMALASIEPVGTVPSAKRQVELAQVTASVMVLLSDAMEKGFP